MTSDDQATKTSLSVDEIAGEARLLAAEGNFAQMARRFQSVLHTWAAPSAVLCLCKDASVEAGWRSIAELASGPVSPAFERSISKLIEESAPGSLSRPVPVRPREDVPGSGVKVRENWLVPWAYGEAYGYLFVRGISRPLSNFGDAVALLGQSLWPRLPGGAPLAQGAAKAAPSALPGLVEQAQQTAERLMAALREEREWLGGAGAQGEPRSADVEAQLAQARKAQTEAETERDGLRGELAALNEKLEATEKRAPDAILNDRFEGLTTRLAEVEGRAAELREKLTAAERARAHAEIERDGARGETVQLKKQIAEQSAQIEDVEARVRAVASGHSEELAGRVAELERRAGELGDKLVAAEKVRTEAEAERDGARSEASALKAKLEEALAQAQSAADGERAAEVARRLSEVEARASELGEKLAAAEQSRAAVEGEREAARGEGVALRAQLEELRGQLSAAAAQVPAPDGRADELARRVAELESGAADISEKLALAERARTEAETERDAERTRVEALKGQIDQARSKQDDDMHWEPVASEEVETLQKQLAEMDTQRRDADRDRVQAEVERDKLRTELDAAKARVDELVAAAEKARSAPEGGDAAAAGSEGEPSRIKAEANRLWQTVESLQQQLQKEAERLSEVATEKERLAAMIDEAKRERDTAQTALLAANEGLQEVENRERGLAARLSKAMDSFRGTVLALRRTPFVSPTLRVAVSGAEEALASESEMDERPAGRVGRVLFLDRDTAGVERLADDLEAAGVEVLIAHYPEEVGFFLKTPDARRLTAMVCDVMAFRGDQNLLDLFRAWRQDVQNLPLLLSFRADNTAETEKAQRIPVVLTAGYLTRPLDRQAVLDAVGMIARRQSPR